MYDLGVRHFAIFFDDISGEGTNPSKQTELLNRLTDDFVKVKGDVSPLTVCPDRLLQTLGRSYGKRQPRYLR